MVCDCGIFWSFSFDCLLLCGSLSPCGDIGWSVACDCGISWLNFLGLFAIVLVVPWVGLWSVIEAFPCHSLLVVCCCVGVCLLVVPWAGL